MAHDAEIGIDGDEIAGHDRARLISLHAAGYRGEPLARAAPHAVRGRIAAHDTRQDERRLAQRLERRHEKRRNTGKILKHDETSSARESEMRRTRARWRGAARSSSS